MFFLIVCLAVFSLQAQPRPELNDGEAHGDPPYLLEDGWTPLLNGKDLSGWHGDGAAANQWFTTAILWDRLLGPTRLSARPSTGGKILNGPRGRTVNLVTDQEFGDSELYLEFMISEGSNSRVYMHGLYEAQVFDSYGSTGPLTSSDCGGIYHRWIDDKGAGGLRCGGRYGTSHRTSHSDGKLSILRCAATFVDQFRESGLAWV